MEPIGRQDTPHEQAPSHSPARGVLCVLALLTGSYFLFLAPGAKGDDAITLHRPAIGAALLIVGAIWTGQQWRPR